MRSKRPRKKRAIKFLAVLLGCLLVMGLAIPTVYSPDVGEATRLETALSALRGTVEAQAKPVQGSYIVFLSFSDGLEQAAVFTGTGISFDVAWASAVEQAQQCESTVDAIWFKADVVTQWEAVKTNALAKTLSSTRSGFFRRGIALDRDFTTAFLEEELNANRIIRYDGQGLRLKSVNNYLSRQGIPKLDALPKTVYLFDTQGWFCGEDGVVHRLYADSLNHGRRVLPEVDGEVALEVLTSATDYLHRQVLENGHFVYGYYAASGKEVSGYNILRHCGTIWSLISAYNITGDATLVPEIETTLACLAREYVECASPDVAYVVERKNGEIKLGGNALAVVAISHYQETFGDDRYEELAVALGNGILTMMDPDTGRYSHVWEYPGFVETEPFRTIYYDGEATFALARLYGMTGDVQWLEAATTALWRFVREDYTRYRDHWVSYAVNEVTKYCPEEAFFTLGLRNAQENLYTIRSRETAYHTYLELLMCTFALYDRIQAEGHSVAYLEEFDFPALLDTIVYRADLMLGAYGWPEQVMYFADPGLAYGSFFIRQDRFRMRIDDVQHFVGGYYAYWENYEKLMDYQKALS